MKQKIIYCCVGVLICALFVGCNDLKQDRQQPQPVQVSDVELTVTDLSLEVGEKQTLTATVLPADAENKTVSWKSADESIAEVSSSGEVTAEGAGETTITATTADGEKTARCTVTVTAKTEPEQEEEPEQEPEPEPEPEPQGEDVPFEVYSARWGKFDDPGKIIVIDSDEELKKYVEGDYPPVDFAKHTLLLARGATTYGIQKITNSLRLLLTGKYKWSIDVTLNDATVVEKWAMAILTDKLDKESEIELYVNIIRN